MPEVIAHRGASAHAPEHTYAAFDLAIGLGADRLELDVRATADGELVIVHDPAIACAAGGRPRRVAELTRDDLARMPAGRRPLTLDAVLRRYRHRTRLLVELKDPEPAWEAHAVAALVRHGVARRAVVQSFDRAALRRLARVAPWLALAALYDAQPSARALRAAARYATAVAVRHEAVDAVLLARARQAGLPVWAWTVNHPADLERLVALGAAGLITDAPDRARTAMAAAAAVAQAA